MTYEWPCFCFNIQMGCFFFVFHVWQTYKGLRIWHVLNVLILYKNTTQNYHLYHLHWIYIEWITCTSVTKEMHLVYYLKALFQRISFLEVLEEEFNLNLSSQINERFWYDYYSQKYVTAIEGTWGLNELKGGVRADLKIVLNRLLNRELTLRLVPDRRRTIVELSRALMEDFEAYQDILIRNAVLKISGMVCDSWFELMDDLTVDLLI